MSRRKNRQKREAELLAEYRKLAKRADQRLVRIERYAKEPKYQNITQFAYKRAMRDIRSWSGATAKRFNTKPPMNKTGTVNLNKLQAKLSDIKSFLSATTSTLKPTPDNAVYNAQGILVGGGIDLTYQKRADTLNRLYGTSVTWENIGELFESQIYRKMMNKYESKEAVRIIGQLQANEKEIKRALTNKKPISIHVTFTDSKGNKQSDEVLEEQVNQALRYYKKDIKSLYKSL